MRASKETRVSIPDFLPSLAAGAHDSGDGEACVMEYVSLLAGEGWSDRPECTHPLLAHEARTVNDELGDRDRHLLVPLIGRLFGTTEDTPELTLRLRLRQVGCVARLLEAAARTRVAGLVGRAEDELVSSHLAGDESDLETEGAADSVQEARAVARAFPAPEGEVEPRHHALHQRAAMMAFVALAGEVDPAQAWALTALIAAHRVAASGECRADCADTAAHARLKVRELADLLDEYDAVTGRTTTRLSPAQARELADLH